VRTLHHRVTLATDDLVQFEELWLQKAAVDPPEGFCSSLRIGVGSRRGLLGSYGDTWLYDSRGYATVLTKAHPTVYRVPNVQRFNEVLARALPRSQWNSDCAAPL
jgi:hypothetical protein